MEKREQLYEGKAKKVFATDDADLVIVDYKDDATAGDGAKKGTIRGKGVVNNRLSNNLMKMLAETTSITTPSSTITTRWPWAWPRRRRSTPSRNMPSR